MTENFNPPLGKRIKIIESGNDSKNIRQKNMQERYNWLSSGCSYFKCLQGVHQEARATNIYIWY